MSSSSGASASSVVRVAGIATAAIAAFTLVRTIFNLEDPTAARASSSRRKRLDVTDGDAESNEARPLPSPSRGRTGSVVDGPTYVTEGSNPATNLYETEELVNEYLLMHFGGKNELLNFPALQGQQMADATAFPKLCAQMCARYVQSVPRFVSLGASRLRALDVGCSVGGASFELARHFGTVIGLDYSHAFVDAANKLKQDGEMPYSMRIEGDLKQHAVARIDADLDRSRVVFVQGDACELSLSALGGVPFHVILGANLLCRLPYPRRFLAALPALLEPQGFLVLPSPYTWLQQYTPKSEWIGGYTDPVTGKEVRSAEALQQIMEEKGHFKLVESSDLPFFVRETARKNQWSVSHVTVWQRTNTHA